MKINELGLNLIKDFEKRKLTAYQDSGGVWTIGWGHTPASKGDVISPLGADEFLKKDLEKFEKVCDYIHVELNDNQFSALVCLAFNIGLNAIKNSTALRLINRHEDPTEAWMRWNKVNGVVVPGLTRRREAEVALWKKPLTV